MLSTVTLILGKSCTLIKRVLSLDEESVLHLIERMKFSKMTFGYRNAKNEVFWEIDR